MNRLETTSPATKAAGLVTILRSAGISAVLLSADLSDTPQRDERDQPELETESAQIELAISFNRFLSYVSISPTEKYVQSGC